MRTTFALFQKYGDARKVVDALIDKNFEKDDINVIAQKSAVENNWNVNERTINVEVSNGVNTLDSLLGRQRPIQTNAAGQVYASGEIAKMITKTAAVPGAVDAGLAGALVDFGLGEETAKLMADGVRGGELLVFVRTEDERAAEAVALINDGKAKNVATVTG